MALQCHSCLRALSPGFIGFMLLLNPHAQTAEECRPTDRWTEVEYRDVITGRYGVDREPVLYECGTYSLARVGSTNRQRSFDALLRMRKPSFANEPAP